MPQVYGLDAEQITRALMALDYGPHIYYFDAARSDGPLERLHSWTGLLYGYALSNLPVIMLCEMKTNHGKEQHAILVVGMRLKTPMEPESPLSTPGHGKIKSFSRNVETFIVHDDRYGAFGELQMTNKQDSEDLSVNIKYPGGSGLGTSATINTLIVPLPSAVNLLSGNAHQLGVQFIRASWTTLLNQPNDTVEFDPYQWVYQTRLALSIGLKAETAKWGNELKNVGKRVRGLALPKWVWVTEGYPEVATIASDGSPIARAILDPTQLRFAGQSLLLGGHVGPKFLNPFAFTRMTPTN